MYNKKWSLLILIVVGMSLVLGACGEQLDSQPPGELPATRLNLVECGKAAANITAKAGSVSSTPNASAGGLRVDLPPDTKLFLSNTFPYAIALPEGWDAKEGQTQGNIKGDLFVIQKTSTSGAYITVISEKLETVMDSKAYFESKLKEFNVQKIEAEQGERMIGGVTAYTLSFNVPTGQPFTHPIQTVQALFVGQGRGWNVSFTASPNQAAQYCPYFARVLDGWTFTGLVK